MPNKEPLPWSRYIPVGLTLGLGVGLSVLAFIIVWNWENRRQDYEFNRRTDDIGIALERQLNADLDVIPSVGDFIKASNQVERSAFRRFVGRPLLGHPSLRVLAWSPRVTQDQRQDFEAKAREEGFSNFQIAERDTQGNLIEAGDRSEYLPIYYIEPITDNPIALGFDLASYADLQPALARARDTGEMVVSGQANLIPGDTSQFSLLAILPIYKNGVDPSSIKARRDLLQGFVLGAFHAQDVFESSLRGRNTNYLHLYLVDVGPTQQEGGTAQKPRLPDLLRRGEKDGFAALYEADTEKVVPGKITERMTAEQNAKANCPLRTTQNQFRATTPCRRLLKISGREWSLDILVTPEYYKTRKHWRSWGILLMGFLWTLIPVTYMLTALSRTTQIEKLAHERALQTKQLHDAYKQLEKEQVKSEQLLLNVLPAPIAERLKHDEHNIADSFAEVTVLFADIVGFTELSGRISASQLVEVLNLIFSAFDSLADKHGLEKIKTIGDAYMVVGGLPTPRPDHAVAMAEMALDMQQEIRRLSLEHNEPFSIRIGINTGPVVAGVIGLKRFIYDLWGDTVNIASRMESHGITGCIQITAATYEFLKDKYEFEKRGAIPVKGKGYMTTFLLTGRKAE